MCLLAASSVANDRLLMAHRTPAWQLRQGDLGYPGSLLSSVDDNAIKRITAGVRARRLVSLAKFDPATGLHPPAQISVERKKGSSPKSVMGLEALRMVEVAVLRDV
jgi:hypothetical protein